MPENELKAGVQLNGALLRAVRAEMAISQETFASAIRKVGADLGEPNSCTKRLVQKWEKGMHKRVRPNYERAIEAVTGVPFAALCSQGSHTSSEALTLPMQLERIAHELSALLESPPYQALLHRRTRRRRLDRSIRELTLLRDELYGVEAQPNDFGAPVRA